MSDLISRELALSHPFANGKYDKENTNLDYILGFESYKEWLETLPTASILDHARAIKEYCDNCALCNNCKFSKEAIHLNGNIWYKCRLREGGCPNMWDLPEGEKGGE